MSKLTADEALARIVEAYKATGNDPYSLSEVWSEAPWALGRKPQPGVSVVEDFGGEGQGDTRYVVFKVDDQYFRKDGYYASYTGTEWDGEFAEVEQVSVQKIEYRKVGQPARESAVDFDSFGDDDSFG